MEESIFGAKEAEAFEAANKGGIATEQVDNNTGEVTTESAEPISTPEKTGTEATATEGVKSEETKAPEGKAVEPDLSKALEDPEFFDKFFSKIITDPKSPFHKNPAFIRMKTQRDEQATRNQQLFERFAKSNPNEARTVLMEDGWSKEDIDTLFSSLKVNEVKLPSKETEQDFDDEGFTKLMKSLKINYDELTAEQKEYWKFQYAFNRAMNKPYDEIKNKFVSQEKSAHEAQVRSEIEKDSSEMYKHAQEKFSLKKEDIDPVLQDYLEEHPKFVGTPSQLFRAAFFDQLSDLGKRSAIVEGEKLNKEKQAINSETGSTGKGVDVLPPEIAESNFTTIFEHIAKKRGYKK